MGGVLLTPALIMFAFTLPYVTQATFIQTRAVNSIALQARDFPIVKRVKNFSENYYTVSVRYRNSRGSSIQFMN
jgi:hypothetical protein